jgi:hypothetical protein
VAKLTSAALLRAVRCLSQDADEQLEELRRLGCPEVVDELALQFHDQAILGEQLLSSGEITEEELGLVRRIDKLLDGMSGEANAALWTPAALRTSPLWTQVRALASEFVRMQR